MATQLGDIIVSAKPYVHTLSQSNRTVNCSSCVKSCGGLKKCSKCGVLKYCSVSCQREDWSVHKEECSYLQHVSPNIPVDSVMLMLRLIIKHKQRDFGKPDKSNETWKRSFLDFKTHKKEIEQDPERMSQFSQIMFTLQKVVGNSLPPATEIFDIFCKMAVNSFTICDGELNPVGVGIYISPSLTDHSCVPNAVVTFCGKTLYLRALEEIKDPTPENIRISYIDQLALTSDRQDQLYKQYYFTCVCTRCSDGEKDKKMRSVKCQNCFLGNMEKDENGFLPCKECGCSVNSTDLSRINKYENYICRSLESLKLERKVQDASQLLQSCIDCHQKQKDYFSSYNIYCIQILDLGLDASIDSENWSQALSYTSLLITPYRLYYPHHSPQIGLLLMKQGKIQLFLKLLKEALTSLQQSGEIIQITHGQDHPLYRDLQELLDQCMEEMRVSLGFSNS